uniref:Tetraspanin n=1 Tax=Timema genevievae TaxID=629358 RepID=A0A7R9K5N3_TIMGE|nr:unnamed protein product [Timema genevievae]
MEVKRKNLLEKPPSVHPTEIRTFDLPAIGGLVFCESSALDHADTELVGIALLTLGALIQATITEVTDFMAGKFSVPSIALIIVGSIVFIVAFYGCCGAIRKNSCMVTTYVIFLMVILVIEIAIASVAFIYKDDFEDVFTDAVTKAVNNYYTDKGSRTSMDALQATVSVTFRYQHQWTHGQGLPGVDGRSTGHYTSISGRTDKGVTSLSWLRSKFESQLGALQMDRPL